MSASKLTLYHYWRSSASWRARWVFALKGIECDFVHIGLLDGEAEGEAHLKRNPLGYVPVLEKDGQYLCESLAIIQWAEENYPKPALMTGDSWKRAQIRMLAEAINASTQPPQNLSVMLHHAPDNPAEQKKWAQHWNQHGLSAYEALVKPLAGRFSVGDEITLADICLIPQCAAAMRQEVDLAAYPTVSRIFKAAMETDACRKSAPENFKPAGA